MARRSLNRKALPYLYLLPAFLLIMGFIIYPVGNVFYYSLFQYNPNKPYANHFIGMGNFVRIFSQDRFFYSSLLISLRWVFTEVTLQLVLGLVMALLLNHSFKGRGLARSIAFTPWAISGVLTALMWSIMFNPNIGIVNDLLLRTGIIKERIAWTANVNTVFWAVIVAELWRGIPFFAIMLLAALQMIPKELYEACKVDGGGRWYAFSRITLPFLKETIVIASLLRGVWEFNNVDLIYSMTGGGPAHMTTTLTTYVVQKTIQANDFGYGSSLATVSFFFLLIMAIVYLRLNNFGKE